MSDEEKGATLEKICGELTVHAQIEEEIFYPALRDAADEFLEELPDGAEVEHSGANDLIAQLEESTPDEPLYDAKVTVLRARTRVMVRARRGSAKVQAPARRGLTPNTHQPGRRI